MKKKQLKQRISNLKCQAADANEVIENLEYKLKEANRYLESTAALKYQRNQLKKDLRVANQHNVALAEELDLALNPEETRKLINMINDLLN